MMYILNQKRMRRVFILHAPIIVVFFLASSEIFFGESEVSPFEVSASSFDSVKINKI